MSVAGALQTPRLAILRTAQPTTIMSTMSSPTWRPGLRIISVAYAKSKLLLRQAIGSDDKHTYLKTPLPTIVVTDSRSIPSQWHVPVSTLSQMRSGTRDSKVSAFLPEGAETYTHVRSNTKKHQRRQREGRSTTIKEIERRRKALLGPSELLCLDRFLLPHCIMLIEFSPPSVTCTYPFEYRPTRQLMA